MLKYKKMNTKSKTRDMLQSSMLKFSPFDYTDTGYLKHLAEQLNLRQARQASIALRKDMKDSNARSNYQNELDRLQMELHRPNLPVPTREHLEKRVSNLKKLIFA